MNYQTRWISTACLSLALLASSATSQATQTPALGTTPDKASGSLTMRDELVAFLDQMERLPEGTRAQVYGGFDFGAARASIEALSAPELEALEGVFGHTASFSSLPSIFENLNLGSLPTGRTAAQTMSGARGLDTAAFRNQLSELTRALRGPGGPNGPLDLDDFDASIAELSDDQLAAVMMGLAPDKNQWSGQGDALIQKALSDCTGSFPNKQICQIQELFNQVANFVTNTIPAFVVSAGNTIIAAIEDLFQALLDILPNENELLALLPITQNNWWVGIGDTIPNIFADATNVVTDEGELVTKLSAPSVCPATGTTLPGIGKVGDVDSYFTCKLDYEWITEALFNVAPKDEWGVPFKIALAAVNFPLRYLCGCFEKATLIRFWDAQQASVALIEPRIDKVVSTIASDTNMQGALIDASNQAVAGTAGLETQVVDLLAHSQVLIAAATAEAADLLALEDARLEELIIADLTFNSGPGAIGQFQLLEPTGYLGRMRDLVAAAITEISAVGGSTGQASQLLGSADAQISNGNLKAAHSLLRDAYGSAVGSL